MHCANLVIISLTLTLLYFAWSDARCSPARGVSKSEADIIVAVHNKYRMQIAKGELASKHPKASNMRRMKWDQNLEKEAQRVAGYCIWEHFDCYDSRFRVGQNLYQSSSTQGYNKVANWTEAITAWWIEHKDSTYGVTLNHFTQVIWADTYLVGCGFRYFLNKENWWEKRYCCNYGPGGNLVGQKAYKEGPGCENLC